MSLAAAFARLPAPEGEWEGRAALGPAPGGAVTMAALAAGGATLDRLLALQRAQVRGGDERLGCAYLIGSLSWEAGTLLAGLWLAGWPVRTVAPEALALSDRLVDWEEEGESGTACALDLALDPRGVDAGPDDPVHLAQAMVSLHEGLVATLVRTTGLGAAAQWRIVGDSLSGALLDRGKAMGATDRALALGRALLADRGTRLHSRQTEFVQVTLPAEARPEEARACDWFRLRGGCCRYYTAEGGEYCTTCVLRPRDEQMARLRAHLASTLEEA